MGMMSKAGINSKSAWYKHEIEPKLVAGLEIVIEEFLLNVVDSEEEVENTTVDIPSVSTEYLLMEMCYRFVIRTTVRVPNRLPKAMSYWLDVVEETLQNE